MRQYVRLALLIGIAATILSPGACTDNSSEERSLKAGDFLNLSQEIINSSSSEMPSELANELNESAVELSLRIVEKALELDGNLSEAWAQKGKLLYLSERYEEAIECYDRVLDEDPTRQDIWMMEGDAIMKIADKNHELERWDEAINCYNMVLSCCRNLKHMGISDSEIKKQEGLAWLKMGQGYYWKADRNSWKAYENNNKIYENYQKDNGKAISCYLEAVEIFSNLNSSEADELNLVDSWMGLSNSLKDIGRYDEAISCYDIIISDFNTSTYLEHVHNAWMNKGISELKIAENQNGKDRENALLQAEKCFAKCLEIDQDDWQAHFGRWAALRSFDKQEADAAFDNVINITGGTRIPTLSDLMDFLQKLFPRATGVLGYASGN
ncbi:MAG: tetratricopeptide repeat protein [Methanothrix sp.]|nr:tetratricopeptide repeat protein [Methanothrix sp.]